MRRLGICLAPSLLALAACASPTVQAVEVIEPAHARVEIEPGATTARVRTRTPFVGEFEAISLHDWAAYELQFDLDREAATRFGSPVPVILYGRLVVASPARPDKEIAVLRVPEADVRALIDHTRDEVETHLPDPHASPPRELARLTLRRAPF